MTRKPNPLWVSYTINALLAQRNDGRLLIVTVQPGKERWLVVALETSATDPAGDAGVDEVLGDHAHENLGGFVDEDEARQRAEKYAARWRRRRPPRRCACPDLGAATPRRPGRRLAEHE